MSNEASGAEVDHRLADKTAQRLHKKLFEKMTQGDILEPVVVDKSFPGVEITVTSRFHTIDTPEVFFGLVVLWEDKKTNSYAEVWTDYKIENGVPRLGSESEEGQDIGGNGAQRALVRAQQLALMLEGSLKIAFEG